MRDPYLQLTPDPTLTAEFKKKKPLAAEAEKAHAKVNQERAKKQKDLDEAQQQLDASEYKEQVHQAVAKEHVCTGGGKRICFMY